MNYRAFSLSTQSQDRTASNKGKKKKLSILIYNHLRCFTIFLFFDKIPHFYPCFVRINTFLTPWN